jgi:hypothetical protein
MQRMLRGNTMEVRQADGAEVGYHVNVSFMWTAFVLFPQKLVAEAIINLSTAIGLYSR